MKWEHVWRGWAGEESGQRTTRAGSTSTVMRCAVLYYVVGPFTEQKMKYVCSDN